MPFKSKKQARWMFSNHPEMAKRWAHHTKNMKSLPELYGIAEGSGKPAIAMDVELFIRVLEWAREDAQSDVQIHDLAENAEQMTAEAGELTMQHYDELVSGLESPSEEIPGDD